MEVSGHLGLSIPVHDQSQVGEARRQAALLAGRLGLDEDTVGRASLVATEAGRNLCLHGQGGEIVISALDWRNQPCLELLAIDGGPGMRDLHQCMRDGYSTAGTPGTGLGSIARSADSFDVYSMPGSGTVLVTRFVSKRNGHQRTDGPLDYSGLSVPCHGEEVCGDDWDVNSSLNAETFFVADGLGHGQFAEDAAREATRIFQQYHARMPAEIMERVHGALRGTRGAAVAIARIDFVQQKVIFSGVGNISAQLVADKVSRSMVSLNGTVGHEMRKVQEFVYPWEKDSLLVMHSDGLATRWVLDNYPGLDRRSPGVIAGVLYRDFTRRRDDVTVLVARCPPA